MPTYYVRPDGSNLNAGTGPAANQAWATVAFALGAASGTNPGLVGGDTVYIAPGTYRNTVTIGYTTPTSMITVQGDPSCSQFSGLTAGPVRITNAPIGDTAPTRGTFFSGTTDYLTLRNIQFDGLSNYSTGLVNLTGGNLTVDKCCFQTYPDSGNGLGLTITISSGKNNITITNSLFLTYGTSISVGLNTQGSSNYATNTVINNCLVVTKSGTAISWTNQTAGQFSGLSINDCTIIGSGQGVASSTANMGTGNTIRNCIIDGNTQRAIFQWNTGSITAINSSLIGAVTTSNVTLTNCVTSMQLFDFGQSRLWGIGQVETYSPQQGSVMINAGTTGGTASDLMGVTWIAPSTPTLGSLERSSTSSVGFYIPAERNASTITIAPGSTSQSIELYLGATGLAFNTSGLQAYYIRNRSAPVAITLVTQTATGAWTSGGFAQISSSLTPGVYRLDVPDAALAAGADDVTIVVRGASGTNGAVMTIKLSSGGLTSAQTASAVWGASPAGYNDSTTFGGVVNETNQLANSLDTQVQDVPSNVWEEMRATHTTAGTFGEYVNAELVTPVTSAALVRMGPYEVKADGLGASDPLDIQKGAQHGVDIQCVDGNGNGIDITSATVTAKIYNSGGSLVDTYSCTATYAADGRATFTIDTTVTNSPGTYTATITRTTGASDTQVFGPLRIYVRDI